MLITSVERGAIVLAETGDPPNVIRATRPEIAVMLRPDGNDGLAGLPGALRDACCVARRTGDWDTLQPAVDE